MGWTYLVLAGLFEVGFTTSLKLSEGFTRVGPSIAFVLSSAASFWLLTRAMHTISLGTAYAVWTGIGACGTALVGIALFGESLSFWRLFFLGTIVGAVAGLKVVSAH
jgi:quaternary ammonium compound-resistance protein SugE